MGRTSLSLVDRIRATQKSVQANKRCADCFEIGPTYICLDFQTFICQTCSGIHREFGHKVRSISLSDWTVQDVEKIERGGNALAMDEWVARWSQAAPEGGELQQVREFIKLKYVEKRWRRRTMSHAAAAARGYTSFPARSSSMPPERQDAIVSTGMRGNSVGDAQTFSAEYGVSDSAMPSQPRLPSAPRPARHHSVDCGSSRERSARLHTGSVAGQWQADFEHPHQAVATSDAAAEEVSRSEVGREGDTRLGERLRRISAGSRCGKDALCLFQGDATAPAPSREDEVLQTSSAASPSAPSVLNEVSPAMPATPVVSTPPKTVYAVVSPCEDTVVCDTGQGPPLHLNEEDNISGEGGTSPAQIFYIGDDEEPSLIGALQPEVTDVETLASELVIPAPASAMADLKDACPVAQQLQQMSPQELLQMQQLISHTLKAREKSPSGTVQISFRPQVESDDNEFAMPPPEFGDLVDVFREKNIVEKHYGWI